MNINAKIELTFVILCWQFASTAAVAKSSKRSRGTGAIKFKWYDSYKPSVKS